jgi:Amidase
MTHECKRHGTTTLFAALDAKAGTDRPVHDPPLRGRVHPLPAADRQADRGRARPAPDPRQLRRPQDRRPEVRLRRLERNQHLGTPHNPWDAADARTPGGSSSGSAVAVATRLLPYAIGTDTGGSVRLPAAWCGITGLKTTVGRVSTHGVLALSPTLERRVR